MHFCMHTPEKAVRCAQDASNLCTHVPTTHKSKTTAVQQHMQVHLNVVTENMKFHTSGEIQQAKLARNLIATLGSPGIKDLKLTIAANTTADLPITTKDADIAEKIFGLDLGSVRTILNCQSMPVVSDQTAICQQLCENQESLARALPQHHVCEGNAFPHNQN